MNRKKIVSNKMLCLTEYIYGIILGVIFLLVIFAMPIISIAVKQTFAHSNFFYLVIGVLIWGMIIMLERACPVKWKKLVKENSQKVIIFCTALFLISLIYWVYSYYFITGWDVGLLLQTTKEVIDGTEISEYATHYLSMYPNNELLFSIFIIILRVAGFFGCTDIVDGVMWILVVQCIASAVAGFFTFKVAENITNSLGMAWKAWFLYILMIGFSPWVSIPYTDGLGIVFPIFILWCFTSLKNSKKTLIKYFAISATTVFAYKLKPQLAIITISVIMVSIFKWIGNKKRHIRWKGCICVLSGIVIALASIHLIVQINPIETHEEEAFGPAHYIMMGLNPYNNGVYWEDDVNYTRSQSAEERTEADLQLASERIKDYGATGIIEHLAKKILTIYGDGTWAWGMEGYFFSNILENQNKVLSPLLKSVYYADGENYGYFLGYSQAMWMMVLLGCNMCFWLRKKEDFEDRMPERVMMLAIVGLTLFELIFEARARYLYCYVPIYILLSCMGMQRLQERLGLYIARTKQ